VVSVHLSDHYISEFRRLWQEEFAEELSPEQAAAEGQRFFSAFCILAGPRRTSQNPNPA
jgi:hypothetical protein